MFLLCFYAICTEMHKEEKMAALKCKEQQRDKRKMQSMETLTAVGRQNTKQQFGNFCYTTHELKCIAMECSFPFI